MDPTITRLRGRLEAALLATDEHTVERLDALIRFDDEVAELLPEVAAMDFGTFGGRTKDLPDHTAKVVAKLAPRLRLRLAALLHDIGKPATARVEGGEVTYRQHEDAGARITVDVLTRLGYDGTLVEQVATIVRMSGRFKNSEEFSDSAARRFAADAGEVLDDLLEFAANDVTSRHQHKHVAQRRQVDALARHIEQVRAADEAAQLRPALDGNAIMALLGVGPGPQVGDAYRMLLADRRERGGQSVDRARQLLAAWAAAQ